MDVVIVAGYPGRFNRMPAVIAWAQRFTDAGLHAVTYANEDPAADFLGVLRSLDSPPVALFACSGNVPVALSALMAESPFEIACAVFLYPYTFDCDDAAKAFGFANPVAGRSVADLKPDVPMLVVRSGRDECPRLNTILDQFIAESLARNLPLTVLNLPDAGHAFDVGEETELVGRVAGEVIRFVEARS